MATIRLDRVTKVYPGGVIAVNDVSLEIAEGEFMVLLGPSGCGKTTLLRTIAGLEQPASGRVYIGEDDVTRLPPRKRNLAMVFQSYAIFPHLKVVDNIGFGLKMRGMGAAEVGPRVRRAAEQVELGEFLDRYPAQLSGGQRQRVALARAIVTEPRVMLMDEPLSNLDALLRLNFRAELKNLAQQLEMTIVYVTHDQVEALSLGQRIAVMRDGRIVQCDTPRVIYDEPATGFVGSFIGNPPMNFLEGDVDDEHRLRIGEHALNDVDVSHLPAGRKVLVGVRAEHIEASAEPIAGALVATAKVIELLGSSLMITAQVGDQQLKLLTRTDFPLVVDGEVWLQPAPERILLYDPETLERITQGVSP